MENQQFEAINKKLEVMIAILLKLLNKNGRELSLREQIALLDDLGVRPVDIARILGRDPRYVNKEIVFLKKSKKAR